MKLAHRARTAGYRLNRFDTLGSTNDAAMARASSGDRGKLWIVADAQTTGRGRQGRAWASPRGNLYASLLLVDAVAPAKAWQLGFVAGVALADAVRSVIGGDRGVAIKWPNDLLAGDAKLAGVLVEGTRAASGAFATVIGFGVNCASHPPRTPYPATDLATLAGGGPSVLDALFEALSARVPEVVALWRAGLAFDAIRALWLDRALAPGTRMSVSVQGERRTGAFTTIDEDGRLVLATPDGPICLEVGDVLATEAPAPAG